MPFKDPKKGKKWKRQYYLSHKNSFMTNKHCTEKIIQKILKKDRQNGGMKIKIKFEIGVFNGKKITLKK